MENAIPLYDEKELFRRVAGGEEAAFANLYRLYNGRLFSFVFRLCKSAEVAEEVTQEIFIKCWQHREALASAGDPGSYMFMMARNATISHLRTIARRRSLHKKIWQRINEIQNSTVDQVDMRESQRMVDEAIRQLSPQKRRIFEMSRMEGLTHEQIASALGLSKSTVNNHLVESTHFIREYLKQRSTIIAIAFTGIMLHNTILH